MGRRPSRSHVRLVRSIERAQSGGVREEVEALRAELAALEEEVDAFRTWSFQDDEDRWWHAQLVKLVGEIEAFAEPATGLLSGASPAHGWGIERRRDWAVSIEERSRSSAAAEGRWREAVASIADPSECPQYRGLEIEPQLGLLPIGRDPDSGLWEFAHLATGDVAERADGDGRLAIDEATGLVFVLLPPGRFDMGAQSLAADRPNHDPDARRQEGPVHRVELSAFFLSKFEMTQAQWTRVSGDNPSYHRPPERASSLAHPRRAGELGSTATA